LTVSISVSDTVTLNTCPHYSTLGTNLSEKGTAWRPLESCSVSPHWDFRVGALGARPCGAGLRTQARLAGGSPSRTPFAPQAHRASRDPAQQRRV